MTDKISMPGPNRKQTAMLVGFFVLACGFVALLWHGLGTNPNKIPSAFLGKPAQTFAASWLQGQEFVEGAKSEGFSMEDFKGRPMILNFWASWCYSCRAEARDFETFWQRYKDRGVAVVGIAIQDSPSAAMEFARTYGKTYILGLDSEDGKAAIDYGVTGVPETFFINREGIVIHKEAGPVSAEILAKYADQLLRN